MMRQKKLKPVAIAVDRVDNGFVVHWYEQHHGHQEQRQRVALDVYGLTSILEELFDDEA